MPEDSSGVRIESMLLADYASIREGLLTVVNAGVTRMGVPGLPSPAHAYLALMVYLPPDQVGRIQHLRLALNYPETAAQLGRIEIDFGAQVAEAYPGEGLHIPFCLPLLGIQFPEYGQVDIIASLNGAHNGSLSFWVVQIPQPD